MTLAAAMTTALSGMLAQTTRVGNTANNIANLDTPGYQRRITSMSDMHPGGVTTTTRPSSEPADPAGSNVDMATEMLDLIGAQTAFAANASVFETGADMWDMLLTIKRD